MVRESRLDKVYAQLLRDHPYGWALYKKVTTQNLRPGICGYFDTDGDWNILVDLTSPDDLVRQGWRAPDDLITRSESPELLVWGPKNSTSVRNHRIGATAGTTTVVAPVEASVTMSFECESEEGAVLTTESPVRQHRIGDESSALQWMADNTTEMLRRHKEVIKRHGIWIVTKTYSTRRSAVAVMTSKSSTVEIGLGVDVQGLLTLTPTSLWSNSRGSSCMELHEDENGVVVFISGIYFSQKLFGSTLKRTREQGKQKDKILRGVLDTLNSDDEEADIELEIQYYPESDPHESGAGEV